MVENLVIYNKALNLVKEIYKLISSNKNLSKDFAISDQIKRASISVVLNISEGYRKSKNHFINHLRIASGSANEVITLLEIISQIYSINTEKLKEEYEGLAKQISSFSTRLKKQ